MGMAKWKARPVEAQTASDRRSHNSINENASIRMGA